MSAGTANSTTSKRRKNKAEVAATVAAPARAVTKEGIVKGHPTARFVTKVPGDPITAPVNMLMCDVDELDDVLDTLSRNGYRDDFYSRVGEHLFHWTCSNYGEHQFLGMQLEGTHSRVSQILLTRCFFIVVCSDFERRPHA